MTVEPPEGDGKSITQIIEEIWQNRDRDYNIRRLVKRLQRIDKQMSGDARELFARFIPDGDVGTVRRGAAASLLRESFTDTMRILRDPDFQKLLIDYPRALRTFIVAPGVTDEVSSEWLIRAGTGQEYKPERVPGGLRLVRRTSTRTRSRRISDPAVAAQGLGRRAADRATPGAHPGARALHRGQPPARLPRRPPQGAGRHHLDGQARRRRDVAAAHRRGARQPGRRPRHRRPRLSADDQAKWMEYIRQHLVANLSIEREDFEAIPVLSDHGGWGRANRVFEGQLAELIDELNEELVAA